MGKYNYSCKKVKKDIVPYFSKEDAAKVAKILGICFNSELFTLDDFTLGMNIELEHGFRFPETNITDDDPIITGKIALAHLNQYADYYDILEELEDIAEKNSPNL